MKKRMTEQQEFEVMKLVFDKFLWAGFGIMFFGIYRMLTINIGNGIYYLILGAAILIALVIIIIREYDIVSKGF